MPYYDAKRSIKDNIIDKILTKGTVLYIENSLHGETYYYLFSLSGFTDAVIETSENENNLFIVDASQIVNDVKQQ